MGLQDGAPLEKTIGKLMKIVICSSMMISWDV
jgi:hypothetical protein